MRLSQFTENKALADTEKVIAKNFSPERSAVKDKIVSLVRDVMMGKGDRMQQAMEITALTKSELEAKSMDPDLEVGVNQNLGMLKRAMEKVVGAKIVDDITEQELEEYKSTAQLRNDAMFAALARLQDKKKEKESPVKKIELPKQLDLFKANEAREIDPKKMQAYMDFKKEKGIDGSSVRMAVDNPDLPETKRLMTNADFAKAVKMYKSALKESLELDEEKGDYVISLKGKEMFRGKSEKDARSAFHKLRKEHGTDVKVKVEESSEPQAITEEEFDVLAEKKDACYRKVKARYKVWPSAYASGALVQCRKVGAANWGNKSKKKKKK